MKHLFLDIVKDKSEDLLLTRRSEEATANRDVNIFTKDNYRCRICGNSSRNKSYQSQEMMLGKKEEFTYFKCSDCGCLQIAEIPNNIGDYYPSDLYYSYNDQKKSIKSRITDYILRCAIHQRMTGCNIIGYLAMRYNDRYDISTRWLNPEYINYNSKILDVGCGNGQLIRLMNKVKFTNLAGVDPFIPHDLSYHNHINIHKKEIFEINEPFDFIMLHHSFEHIPEPQKTLSHLNSILSKKGTLIIRIPLSDSQVWEEYENYWYQIDAPRHFFLHTKKSMQLMADNSNFYIEKIVYDSNYNQFFFSDVFSKGFSWSNLPTISNSEKRRLKKKSIEVNSQQKGDQACFILKKTAIQ